MTESQETPPEAPAAVAEIPTVDLDEPTESEDEPDDGNEEAKKYRLRLRDSEARADQLAQQVEALQRQHVEALVTAAGLKPQAVWSVTDLPAMLDDDGSVNAEHVAAAVTAASETLGVQPKPTHGLYVPAEGRNPGPSAASGRDQWNAQFKPSHSR